jgi:hypothetical protein
MLRISLKLLATYIIICCLVALARAQLSTTHAGLGSASGGGGGGGDYISNLVHRWPMDDANVPGGTTINDTAPGGTLNGTAVGGVSSAAGPPAPGILATARALDGASGSQIQLPVSPAPFDWNSGSFSVGGWAFITNITNLSQDGGNDQIYLNMDIDGGGVDYLIIANLHATTGGGFYLNVSGQSWRVLTGVMVNSVWAHLFITNSGGGHTGTVVMYKNGAALSPTTSASSISFGVASSYNLGAANSTMANLAGRLSSWRIYSRALTPTDVLALYTNGG